MTQNEQPAAVPDAATILRSIGEVTYAWRIDTDALTWSDNAAAVFALAPEEIGSGRAFAARVEAETGQTRADALAEEASAGQTGAVYQLQYALKRPDGDKVWLEDHGRWFAGPDGRPARAHGVVRVITTRYEQEQKLTRLARLDPLTGELNSAALIETLTATLDETVRFRGSCGFLLVAIDHLRQINEAYGFDVAEDVIAKVAQRIRARLRSKDHLGRFSGNKFGVVLTRCTTDELVVAAERLVAGVRDETVATAVGPVAVTITIGGVNAPRHARTVPEIISRAQDALHQARTKRRGSFQAFQPSLERETLRRDSVRATDEIVAALNDRRIALAYEPVVDAQSRALAFYECLMRVYRQDGQIAQANQIIPVAERIGLVRMLDHRVLELVTAELSAAPNLHASVNVSAASAVDPGWWLGLGAMLRASGNVAERLVVEITETAAIHDVDDARGFVSRVKDLGCRIAIDDFGAGHTSFRNLRRLGVDIIKIDGAFVQNIAKSDDDRAFVQTMIDLARRLGLKTVAEWVQDEEAALLLAGWGCDYLQGSLIGLASTERPWTTDNGNAVAG